ncbi:A/G-specific adenine glycosylase [Fundidesulfovibrio terrae]|uniref:A/G-specific adenine glycosylase n=1 Tax=Fundidesulfovibrio terrae TaxID=2922866 RepID=UPI001FAF13DC|nr:A/G-specific adenine glycosylase [Fundidesulfovibrio terrae]
MPDSSSFSDLLLEWFRANKRPLPWRLTYDPYHVWLSEIMLQQTQMDRAVAYFNRFLGRFPTIHNLARASEDEVLRFWEGLGYYSRARNLLKAAREIVSRHAGVIPADAAALGALPGVGRYTTGAVLSIAYNEDVPAVDANVERVLARCFDIALSPKDPSAKPYFTELAASLIPAGQARDFNQALMEFGALVCTPRDPSCAACPLAGVCKALAAGTVEDRPALPAAKPAVHIGMGTAVIQHKGLFFVQKRTPGGVWAGLWEFPGGQMEPGEEPEQTALREVAEETGFTVRSLGKLAVIKHSYTRYRVTMHAYLAAFPEGAEPPEPVLTAATSYRWLPFDALANLAFPTAMRKLAQAMERDPRIAR